MPEDKIKNLLQKADETAGEPMPVSINIPAVRRRVNRRRFVSVTTPIAAAAAILVAFGLWSLTKQQKIASLERQIEQLQTRADATFNLIQEVLEDERKQQRLDELQAQLASIPDPLEEIRKQVDTAAFNLVYQADRMYGELNLKSSAIKTYKRVIEIFPETQWAEVAHQRLSEIKKGQYKKDSKGDLLWKPQNVSSSC
jgi:tetratricopeptide (TPR) repeat protein